MMRPFIDRLRAPRLLPLTIAGMAALLMLKCAGLVLAAAPAAEPAPAAPKSGPPPVADAKPAAKAAPPVDPGAPAPAAPSMPPAPAASAPGASEEHVLSELRARREALDAREAALRARESVLAATARTLEARIGEMKALQARLEQLDAKRRQQQDEDWGGLVTVYEKMKPREAARIFDELDMSVLLHLLDRMKQSKAAAVLAAMQPDKARESTTELASLREHRTDPEGEAK